jgi:hypothetical protein
VATVPDRYAFSDAGQCRLFCDRVDDACSSFGAEGQDLSA